MLYALNSVFPIRYTALILSTLGLLVSAATVVFLGQGWIALVVFLALTGVGLFDLAQRKSSVLRNYPLIGHVRYMMEFVRPEPSWRYMQRGTNG